MENKKTYNLDDWGEEGIPGEILRLKKQVDYSLDKELRVWDNLGFSDGMKFLEPGSGPGWLTKVIRQKYPNSPITTVELDPKMNEILRKVLTSEELEMVDVVESSIENTGFPNNYFDVAIVRAVLQHIEKPQIAIAEIYRVLKPGGVIYILDGDQGIEGLMDPKIEKLDAFSNRIKKIFSQQRGSPEISRHLPKMLKEQGFHSVDFDAVAFHSEIIGKDVLRDYDDKNALLPLINAGVVTHEEADEMISEVMNFLNDPDSILISWAFITTGVK